MGAKQKIYITRRIPQPGIDYLSERFEVEVNPEDRVLRREELLEAVKSADGILCLLTDKIDAEFFDAAQHLKGVANYAVGYDNIDVPEASRRGIPVSNTPGVLTDATAEMAWTLLFSVARRVVESDGLMRSGAWGGWGPLQFIGGDVSGKTLGIVGTGRIGTAMALKSQGFNMKVIYTDIADNPVLDEKCNARRVDFDTLLRESDFISIHVPLMESTRHLFNTDTFKKMKPSAYLINTSRGPVVNEAELVQALKNKELAGAGLDVYENEPAMVDGLADQVNTVLTPHTASATEEARTNMALKAARNLASMLEEGVAPPDCVNKEIL
ncbi:MAG TPA: D-glycerate dehydrogenase [Halalkalibaculum sp.]|nr:D-glycerate dehydrogenase [Halalkalibaculum sp.]